MRGGTIRIPLVGVSYIGPKAALRDCTVVVPARARLSVVTSTLDACTISAQASSDLFLLGGTFDGCRFEGTYDEVVFGPRQTGQGDVRRCDFTRARMHLCEFRNCDATTSKFASWPTVVVPDPARHRERLLAIKWPNVVRSKLLLMSNPVRASSAVVLDAERLAEDARVDVESLRAGFQALDDILLQTR